MIGRDAPPRPPDISEVSFPRRDTLQSGALVVACAVCVVLFYTPCIKADGPSHSPTAAPAWPSSAVILVSVDTLRADRLSCYGYKRQLTPHIDALARSGTLFSAVSAQVPLTLPSHASMLTSTYPFSTGVEDNGQQLGRSAVTLAAVLKDHGYQTAAFVGAYVLDRRFGLNRGFDFYDSPFNLRGWEGKEPGEIKRFGEDVLKAAELWLMQHSRKPFFIFVHLYDLHTPYEVPRGSRMRASKLTYDDEVNYVDDQLGRFWQFLKQRNLWEQCLVVFTSDHGEGLGDHGETTHGYFIYQSTLRVPLIFHWANAHRPDRHSPSGPGRMAKSFPTHVDVPVGLLNVAPTILQFVGIPAPREFQGKGLLTMLNGQLAIQNELVESESLFGRRHFGVAALESIRLGQYKYVEAPSPELFNLASDPGELRNLYERQRSLARELHDDLASLRARYGRTQSSLTERLDPETVERLRSLGYMSLTTSRAELAKSGLDPKDRIAQYEEFGRASALSSRGRWLEANALLAELLARDPSIPDARLTLGLNQQKLGDHREAVKNFEEVLKNDALNSVAHFNLAVSLYALHDQAQAAKECEVTLAISPTYVRAEELLATIFMQQKQYEQARTHFTRVLEVAPGDYAALYNLGVLAAMQGRWEEGERQLRSALHEDPGSAEAHNALGSVCLRRGDLECADAEFRRAIQLKPEFVWAHYNLGLVYRQEQRRDDAAREFREALNADPRFEPARQALASMGTKQP